MENNKQGGGALLVIIDPQADFITQGSFYSQNHGLNQIGNAVLYIEKFVENWNGSM